ncbi:hypothetical protein GCK72_025372 [Caenorhabditis remanei]|nr:hypothetical protein GCK72_025372 [Caenorhabditis remanei]KAF1748905.1 hypothetical protein GCK72_025372 [Caenorhabditis remanei]
MDAGPRIEEVCAVCQDQKLHPVTINCGHVFCYKCIKSLIHTEQDRGIVHPKCPTCRRDVNVDVLWEKQQYNLKARLPDGFGQNIINGQVIIPGPQNVVNIPAIRRAQAAYVEVPDEILAAANQALRANNNATIFWLYAGSRGGWWRYDERDEREIEVAFQERRARLNLDFCGKTYVISLSTMMQYERENSRKARMIKRVNKTEFDQMDVKGIAGLLNPKVWTVE